MNDSGVIFDLQQQGGRKRPQIPRSPSQMAGLLAFGGEQ